MDDDETICKISSLALTRMGYDTDTVPSGPAALEAYKSAINNGRPYVAVILDLTLGEGMSGLEALQKLRMINPDVYAIVSSGSSAETMANYKAQGFNDCLPKPFRLQDITECISKLKPIEPA